MPLSAVYSATDPCEYGGFIRGSNVDVLVNARGDFRAKVARIDFQTLWMQRGQENLPRIFRSNPPADRVIVSFITEASAPVIRLGGTEITGRQIVVMSPGQLSPWRSLGACRWCAMSLPAEDFISWGRVLTGREIAPPRSQLVLTPPAPVMTRLQELHRAAGRLAATSPAILASANAARQLEQTLLGAMFACISAGTIAESATARHHRKLIVRFEELLDTNLDSPLAMPEVCAKLAAPGRTLRACCAELLGMSPKQYLQLRRMHLARSALLQADGNIVTVTGIATQYGFWELGRFAVAYRSLFGESPSATLKRGFSGRCSCGAPAIRVPFANSA